MNAECAVVCWLTVTTPCFLGRPRSTEPASVLAWAGVVSCAGGPLSYSTGAGHAPQPVTVSGAKCLEAVEDRNGRLLVRILWLGRLMLGGISDKRQRSSSATRRRRCLKSVPARWRGVAKARTSARLTSVQTMSDHAAVL